ncbi:hypothetical protein BpHYR1_034645, partial [Brachionus plicatilis]
KPSQIKKFYKKFLVVCSSVFANNNLQNKLSTREIRQRFQQGSIEKPSFEEWFKNKCFITWDKKSEKLILKNDLQVQSPGELSQTIQNPLGDVLLIEVVN